jgi:hypothetical protein
VDDNMVVDQADVTAVNDAVTQNVTITAIRDTTREVRPPNVDPADWPAIIRFDRGSSVNSDPLTINIHLGGTATNGADYATLPTSITIAAGQAYYDLVVTPVHDDNVENPDNGESIQVTVTGAEVYPLSMNTNVAFAYILDNDFWAWDRAATIGDDWMWGGPPTYPIYVPWGWASSGSFFTQGAADALDLPEESNEVGITVGGFARWTEPGWIGYYDPVEVTDGFNQRFAFNPTTGQITITENGDSSGVKQNGDLKFAIASEYQYDNEGDDEHWVQIDIDVAWAVAGTVTKTTSGEAIGFKAESSFTGSYGTANSAHIMFKFFLRREELY